MCLYENEMFVSVCVRLHNFHININERSFRAHLDMLQPKFQLMRTNGILLCHFIYDRPMTHRKHLFPQKDEENSKQLLFYIFIVGIIFTWFLFSCSSNGIRMDPGNT